MHSHFLILNTSSLTFIIPPSSCNGYSPNVLLPSKIISLYPTTFKVYLSFELDALFLTPLIEPITLLIFGSQPTDAILSVPYVFPLFAIIFVVLSGVNLGDSNPLIDDTSSG